MQGMFAWYSLHVRVAGGMPPVTARRYAEPQYPGIRNGLAYNHKEPRCPYGVWLCAGGGKHDAVAAGG